MSPSLAFGIGEPVGQGWTQVWELLLALLLCSLIGLERELKQKSAGLRTHTLVGVGAALFLLVSKYGFTDVLAEGRVVLDPPLLWRKSMPQRGPNEWRRMSCPASVSSAAA